MIKYINLNIFHVSQHILDLTFKKFQFSVYLTFLLSLSEAFLEFTVYHIYENNTSISSFIISNSWNKSFKTWEIYSSISNSMYCISIKTGNYLLTSNLQETLLLGLWVLMLPFSDDLIDTPDVLPLRKFCGAKHNDILYFSISTSANSID